MIKGIAIGFILAVAISAGSVFLYFSAGLAPVATADPPMPFEKRLANMALDTHIEKQHIPASPVQADEANFPAGATVYKRQCALCHGLPGRSLIDCATTVFPKPPQLFRGKGVTDDPAVGDFLGRQPTESAFRGRPPSSELLADANEIPDSVKKVLISDLSTSASAPPVH